jgi:hypothetical protein
MNLKQELIKRKEEPLIKFLLGQIKERNECLIEQNNLIETMAKRIEDLEFECKV